ncbi:MAG: pyridoxal-phosphate dependent enzyme [Treponema sp.]|nr:pyridoxal-phosphate dependent enzyme [Treponema sp.]
MKFTSTRNQNTSANFSSAILNCMPEDGGLYVPCNTEDLRRWILYTDEKTKFSSIAGSLTSAFINDEFSPIICETIATKAFPFSPEIKQLDENLYILELFHTPTGIHRDFGISFLTSCIETILTLAGGSSVFLDVSSGELGASLAHFLRGKKHLKAVIVYPKGKIRGLKESDYVWNGGNVLPVEIDGSEQDCHQLVRSVFADRAFIQQNHITVANTANIGRLLPQAFFYPYAFSRIKGKIRGSVEYALAPGNYSNLVAGLYAWQFALPLNGFVIPATQDISTDAHGEPVLLDSVVPLDKRYNADPSEPSNIERLENVFRANSMMMRHFIYPQPIEKNDVDKAAKELFKKYGLYADRHTARAYAAIQSRQKSGESDGVTTVLIARDSPSLSDDFIQHTLGEIPQMPESIKESFAPVKISRPLIKSPEELKKLFDELK